MTRKIIILRIQDKIVTFVKDGDEFVDIYVDQDGDTIETSSFQLGDIYIGRVKRIVSNINAAFIEIAPGVECYYDMSEVEDAIFTKKIGKKPLCQDEEFVVQISREAMKSKRMTVTTKISMTGEYAVITSGDSRFGVSRKITGTRRSELLTLLKSYKAEENEKNIYNDLQKNIPFGIILRTNASTTSDQVIHADIDEQLTKMMKLVTYAPSRTCFSKMNDSSAPYLKTLANIYKTNDIEIVTDDTELYHELSNSLLGLTLYSDALLPLRKLHNIDRLLKRCLSECVWLKSGGYLIIQPTEALTVIDVNSGSYEKKSDFEETKYRVNLEAAQEISKQLRLRNLSGIIIVDFINMKTKEYEDELMQHMIGYIKKDPIQTTLVGMTKLRLVEMTRKKVRKPLYATGLNVDISMISEYK